MLAINGGKPIRTSNWQQWPIWDDKTKEQLVSVLESGRWTISGVYKGALSKCEEAETKFANFNNINYCVVTDHGTSALLIALEALGIGPGDEVIVPALTWVASSIVVCDVNAVPVIVDVDPETYCISIDAIKKAITPRTKAIMPVHLYGCVANMTEIKEIADKHGLYIIEDASHSHGSVWDGKYVGTIGDIGAFSMHQGKVLTSGEGGAALTADQRLYEKMIELRSNSRLYCKESDLQIDKMQLIANGRIMGSNYCQSEFHAAVLLDQLDRLEEVNRLKETNALYLDALLLSIPGVKTMFRHPSIKKQSYYRYAFKIEPDYFSGKLVSSICKALEAEINMVVEQPYQPLHKADLYNPQTKRKYYWSDDYVDALSTEKYVLPVAEKASYNEGVVIHHSILLGNKNDMEQIAEAIKKVQLYSETL